MLFLNIFYIICNLIINKITPIKDEVSKEEAEDAIKSFLSEILSSDKLIKQEDILSIETTIITVHRQL